MRLVVLGLVLCLACCSSAFGQEGPRVEVFGGYSYLNVDTNGLSSRQSANGWEASVNGNFNRIFSIEGSVSGYYKNILGINVRDYSYVGGPRFNYRTAQATVFAHALIGGDHLSGNYSGFSVGSQDGFAAAFGGGVQWNVAPRWAVRGSADYVLTRHDILAAQSYTQNNFRASVGVVYMFGFRESGPRPPRREHEHAAAPACSNASEAALLGVVGCGTSAGFTVSSVHFGSPAAAAGIAPGDVIISIDGRPVRDAREIEAAIAANAVGTVRVSYMLKGNWLAERDVKVR
jgi:Outer membrane protein beta-barrel domain/PDZ domain